LKPVPIFVPWNTLFRFCDGSEPSAVTSHIGQRHRLVLEQKVRDCPRHATLKRGLILLSQKVARFEFENQLFEKIQGLAGRC
jgi:hypothetical protein